MHVHMATIITYLHTCMKNVNLCFMIYSYIYCSIVQNTYESTNFTIYKAEVINIKHLKIYRKESAKLPIIHQVLNGWPPMSLKSPFHFSPPQPNEAMYQAETNLC